VFESSLTSDATSIVDFVANNPLFYSLSKDVIQSVVSQLQERRYPSGETVVEEGSIGDCFYLIRKGNVRVIRGTGDEELVLSELGTGEGFGEMALLIDQPRSATVKANGDTHLLILNRDDFVRLTRLHPALSEKMNKLLSERVSLLEGEDSDDADNKVKFRATRSLALDYAYLDLLMRLNEASGGNQQVEHCKETGQLAREMSKMLCPMVSEEILFAGYLHEIGKVSLPRELVEKERRGEILTDEENARFANLFGNTVAILAPNPNLHEAVSFIQFLSEPDYHRMPLEAQILKVADDFLTYSSPYYRNLGYAKALEVVLLGSGTLYNPRVLAALEKNIRKFTEVQVDSQLSVLRMMVLALDRKDNYTYRHSMDVRDMALRIVNKLGLGRKEQEYTRIGSELHDVGKIYIDESVLNAPRKLTDAEFDIMKTHAARSADFLADIPGMDELASIVRAHHEKFDGSGYPDGLAGEDIPFLARVMTIADVWSALTTPRVYRLNADGSKKAFGPEKALEIMSDMNSKGHFDPTLFPVFQVIVHEMIADLAAQTPI
jgi:HD-GYP domain-containing protein (c-di-GMP phosphodiesterase class II)/CRP-like cAMP-binding protein